MAWGIEFNADIHLSRQDYNSNIYLVKDKLDEISTDINRIKSKILMFITANIKDIVPDDWKDSPINWLGQEMNELFEYYEELSIEQFKLSLYLEHLETLTAKIKNE